MPELSVLVDGGKASAGAPLGPALGPMGVNIGEVVLKINEKTKAFIGMKVPVKITIDAATKAFDVEVGSPPASALVKKELGIEKGAANPKTEVVGNMTLDQVKKVAEMKISNMNSYELRSAAREIIGVCDSMGVQVEGLRGKDMQKRFDAGEFTDIFGAPRVKKEYALTALPKREKGKPLPAEDAKPVATPSKGVEPVKHEPVKHEAPKHEPAKVPAAKPEPVMAKPVVPPLQAASKVQAPAHVEATVKAVHVAPKVESPKVHSPHPGVLQSVAPQPKSAPAAGSAIQEHQKALSGTKPKSTASTAMTHTMAEDRNTLIIRPKKKTQ